VTVGYRSITKATVERWALTATGGIDFGPAGEQEKMYEILRASGVRPAQSPGCWLPLWLWLWSS
jgi:hypothetical protein